MAIGFALSCADFTIRPPEPTRATSFGPLSATTKESPDSATALTLCNIASGISPSGPCGVRVVHGPQDQLRTSAQTRKSVLLPVIARDTENFRSSPESRDNGNVWPVHSALPLLRT